MHTSPYKTLGTEHPVCGKNRAEFHGAAFTSLKAIVGSGPQAAPAAQCIVALSIGTGPRHRIATHPNPFILHAPSGFAKFRLGSQLVVVRSCARDLYQCTVSGQSSTPRARRWVISNCSGRLRRKEAESGDLVRLGPSGAGEFGGAVQKLVRFFCGGVSPFFLPQKNQKNQKSSGAKGETAEK